MADPRQEMRVYMQRMMGKIVAAVQNYTDEPMTMDETTAHIPDEELRFALWAAIGLVAAESNMLAKEWGMTRDLIFRLVGEVLLED